ncbi:MAG: C-terminal binding protein [Fimbriimonadaceae bacterium]|nr:C-terminal binding protein [Fimbriimonadaceae bacterium]
MSLPRVLITDFLASEPELERAELAGVAEVEVCAAGHERELAAVLPLADALIVWHVIQIGPASIAALPRCRVIVRAGVGYDNVDGVAAAARGIPLANVPDYGTEDVADHAVALALSLIRKVPRAAADLAAGRWEWRQLAPVPRLRGLPVGLVGLGRIGTAAALRFKAFGCDVAFVDPYRPDGADKALGLRRCETLAELLGSSQIVSLHVPLTAETRRLIDAAALAQMRDDAVLVNTARGGVVDTASVAAALAAGRLSGVGIDVLPQEPATVADPLYAGWTAGAAWRERVILTPHVAWYSVDGLAEMRRKAAVTVRRVLLGQPVRNIVNGVSPG